ncbi:MAG: DUF4268 domain-containing protein [Methanocalculus sp. MSAO_Arc2]|uniref:DUF4268 domain-containing protein n=1 Tax=Methanocalculus sp. MSAO_Arc2 TaxID=2293855 RepID=UPI000FF13387|nr:MAG: DUF4268 domain-containing protein [Methanocalculus sp. MSAO_Arc2]
MIEKIQRVSLREVWRHESLDFTTWMEENIDVLNDALDLSLSNVLREQNAGDFSVDLVAEDNEGNVVVIENQLERSNHDHLGKLITYLAALEAKVAIWIVSDPRSEHTKAIAWLNESYAAAFYLVKVEAIKIGDSSPAPLLTLIAGPSREAIMAGVTKKELAERHQARYKFWTELLNRAKLKTKLHAHISPGYYNWIGTSAGLPFGLNLNYSVRRHDAQVELYIYYDQDTGEGNKIIFEQLYQKKAEIEETFGEPLDWEALEGKRACRIRKKIPIAGWIDETNWPAAHEAMADAMIRLEKSLRPHIKNLELPKKVKYSGQELD